MTGVPVQTGQVTAADLYGEVTAARRDIQNVLTKVEVMGSQNVTMAGQLADHEARIRLLDDRIPDHAAARLTAVERWQWRAAGAIGILAIIAGVISGWLASVLTHVH